MNERANAELVGHGGRVVIARIVDQQDQIDDVTRDGFVRLSQRLASLVSGKHDDDLLTVKHACTSRRKVRPPRSGALLLHVAYHGDAGMRGSGLLRTVTLRDAFEALAPHRF
jgi:hypothetical protein